MTLSDGKTSRTRVEAVELADQSAVTYHTSRGQIAGRAGFADIQHSNSRDSDSLENQDGVLHSTMSTRADAANMRRMGKSQQLVRHFRLFSITAFTAIATASWEIGIFQITPALVDGGRAGLLYNMLWNLIFFGPVYLSMAEMASMAPIAGSQYHWVSEFAPDSCQRFLSYLTGWTSTIAWQAGNALGIFLVGSLVQTIILVNDISYSFPSWQGTLLAVGAMIIAYVGNVYGSKVLPYWQTTVFAVHIAAYFAYIVPIWVNAPAASHQQVWLEFQNSGGWSNMGLAVLVGQLSGVSQQVGLDTAAHMSEEVKDAASTIPKAIMINYFISFILVFPALLTICYHVPDLKAALHDPTTYPAIYVLRQSMSTGWITLILVIICCLNVASNIAYLAAVTRDLFAFARDQGLPFAKWLQKIHPRRQIPVNACNFSCSVAVLLSLIYIGSPVAFYAMTSLCIVALLQCYSLSIGCVLWRRIYKPETLPPATFSLGRWGVPINAISVLYSSWAFFWSFWPQTTPTTAAGFNWASPIFVLVLLVSMVYFFFRAKHNYFGPVTEVEGRGAHRES